MTTAAPITSSDLANALTAAELIELFDDDNDGTADAAPLTLCIGRAWSIVESYLVGFYTQPLPVPLDRLVVDCTLQFAVALARQRKPEYARSFPESPADSLAAAHQQMERIQAAIQRLPDNAGAGTKPATVGGTTYDYGGKIVGTDGGDF